MYARGRALGTFDRVYEVIAFERVLRGLAIPTDRSPQLAAAQKVLRERDGFEIAGLLRADSRFEPLARELVTDEPIAIGQHRVRRFANERVTKRELGLAAEATL